MRILKSVVVAAIILAACNKTKEPPQKIVLPLPVDQVADNSTSGSGGDFYSCSSTEVSPVTFYTGPTDPSALPDGFGVFANANYDKGWRDGYQDAMFYYDYYGGTVPSCSYQLLVSVERNGSTISVAYESYNREINDNVLGYYVDAGCQLNDWPLLKCLLRNEYTAKTYRSYLEYNVAYTGSRTQAQIDYDNGKLDAFNTATLRQPLSP